MAHPKLATLLTTVPLVAILRGITPDEVDNVLAVLMESGFKIIEVPLNSPDPITTIARLIARAPEDVIIGAGTVLNLDDVYRLADIGTQLIVTPHLDLKLVAAAQNSQMIMAAGCMTPSEVLIANQNGVDIVKLFPAKQLGIDYYRALKTVLPPDLAVFPVGGIDVDNMANWFAAGCQGLGFGSALYSPAIDSATLRQRAQTIIARWQQIHLDTP